MRYHIWTIGCQMNVADTQRLASELERLGHRAAADPDEADILVVNTCVVRQSAENKAYGRLTPAITRPPPALPVTTCKTAWTQARLSCPPTSAGR
jgi:tRNA A37 methylthiotransferase MiaB